MTRSSGKVSGEWWSWWRMPTRLLVIALMADVLAVGTFAYLQKSDPMLILAIRNSIFTDYRDNRAHFSASPDALLRDGFKFDSPDKIKKWAHRLSADIDWVSTAAELGGSTISKVKALVPLYSRNGGGNVCGVFNGLEDNLQRIGTDEGYGCCSDHSQAFLAVASMMDITAREVHHSSHTFVEFYDEDGKRWIYVDPQYAIMAKDESDAYLSLMEIRDAYFASDDGRDAVHYEFIGNEFHLFSDASLPNRNRYYDAPADFANVSMTLGSNVFAQEEFDSRISFLPKPLRHLLGFLTGVFPQFSMLVDQHSQAEVAGTEIRTRFFALVAVLVAFNLAYPAHALYLRYGSSEQEAST